MDTVSVYAIFPYLKTSHAISLRGIVFRSSDDLEGLSVEQQTHLKTLFSMFFLQNDLHIKRVIYAILEFGGNQEENQRLEQRLYQAQSLINYFYAIPHPMNGTPFLHFEHASLYAFQPKLIDASLIWPEDPGIDYGVENLAKEPVPSDAYILGYEGRYNGDSFFWVTAGNRIYPPLPSLTLNISQTLALNLDDFASDDKNWALIDLITGRGIEDPKLEERIFIALEWHNRSTAQDVRPEVELIALAIAFECLLALPSGEKVTERFRETIMTLLGPIPRLDSWIEQFYKARSAVVHDGKARHLQFYAVERDQLSNVYKAKESEETAVQYRSLISYGRRIFRLCLNILLSGARMAEREKLRSAFIHNQERLKQICKQLEAKATPEYRLQSVASDINDLHTYRWESRQLVDLETLMGAGKLVAQTYLDTKPQLPEEVEKAAQAILQSGTKLLQEKMHLFQQFDSAIEQWQNGTASISSPFEPQALISIVRSFLRYLNSPNFRIVIRQKGKGS